MKGQKVNYVGVVAAGLVGLAVFLTAILLLTGGEDDAPPVNIVAPEAKPGQAGEPAPRPDIMVQVSGEVVFPGVYAMESGDRLIDAIAAAGGIAPNADLSGVNLSKRVQDETRYHIPAMGEATPVVAREMTSAAKDSGGLIDLNTAQDNELQTLPGIGPSLAGAILAYREDNGPFSSVDDVDKVPGIGPKTLDSIRPLVTVSGRP